MCGGLRGWAVQEFVRDFFKAFKTQISAAHHQQRRDRPRNESTDGQRGGHQNRLVDKRAFGDSPNHRQFTLGLDAGDLLGVERQIVAQHTGGFFGGDFGKHRHVVEHGGNVINQRKQATGHIF